jgi:hypothetical protein
MGRDRNVADRDLDLGPVVRVSTVPHPTAQDPRGRAGSAGTGRGATGRLPVSGATASPVGPRDSGRSSGARLGRGRSGSDRPNAHGRSDRPNALGRSDRPNARGRSGLPATTAHGTTGRAMTGREMTARGVIDRPVHDRPMTGDRVAAPNVGPFAPSDRRRCRHPRSSGRTRS